MLKVAFNALTKIHSRSAILKRLGEVDLYSPIRITPSNFFRFLAGPEYTTIPGKEFIIGLDSIRGSFAQTLSFASPPTTGDFKIQLGMSSTGSLSYNSSAAQIQTALREITGLENCVVSGNPTIGFLITFLGFQTPPGLGQIVDSTLDEAGAFQATFTKWDDYTPEKGDRILDGSKVYSVDEVMEMHDLGGSVMGVRVRVD